MDQALMLRIRERAYHIWATNGGEADQNWLRAETEILNNSATQPQRRGPRNSSQVLSSGRQRGRFRLGKPLRRKLDAWRLSPSDIRECTKSPRLAGITISAERVRKNRRVRACARLSSLSIRDRGRSQGPRDFNSRPAPQKATVATP